MIHSLAQVETPLVTAQETTPDIIAAVWSKLYAQCLTMPGMSEDQCRGLLGYKAIYFPPTCVEKPEKPKFTLPWWGYMIAGWLIARYI